MGSQAQAATPSFIHGYQRSNLLLHTWVAGYLPGLIFPVIIDTSCKELSQPSLGLVKPWFFDFQAKKTFLCIHSLASQTHFLPPTLQTMLLSNYTLCLYGPLPMFLTRIVICYFSQQLLFSENFIFHLFFGCPREPTLNLFTIMIIFCLV